MFLERPWQDESGDSLFLNRSFDLDHVGLGFNWGHKENVLLNLQQGNALLFVRGREVPAQFSHHLGGSHLGRVII